MLKSLLIVAAAIAFGKVDGDLALLSQGVHTILNPIQTLTQAISSSVSSATATANAQSITNIYTTKGDGSSKDSAISNQHGGGSQINHHAGGYGQSNHSPVNFDFQHRDGNPRSGQAYVSTMTDSSTSYNAREQSNLVALYTMPQAQNPPTGVIYSGQPVYYQPQTVTYLAPPPPNPQPISFQMYGQPNYPPSHLSTLMPPPPPPKPSHPPSPSLPPRHGQLMVSPPPKPPSPSIHTTKTPPPTTHAYQPPSTTSRKTTPYTTKYTPPPTHPTPTTMNTPPNQPPSSHPHLYFSGALTQAGQKEAENAFSFGSAYNYGNGFSWGQGYGLDNENFMSDGRFNFMTRSSNANFSTTNSTESKRMIALFDQEKNSSISRPFDPRNFRAANATVAKRLLPLTTPDSLNQTKKKRSSFHMRLLSLEKRGSSNSTN